MGFRELTELKRHCAGQAGGLLTDFYVPILNEAVRYDRQAGYFDSVSLVQVASGVAAFIHQVRALPAVERPPMRLIAGATWSPDDIEAYQRGQTALSDALGHALLRHFEPSAGYAGFRPRPIGGTIRGSVGVLLGARRRGVGSDEQRLADRREIRGQGSHR